MVPFGVPDTQFSFAFSVIEIKSLFDIPWPSLSLSLSLALLTFRKPTLDEFIHSKPRVFIMCD